MAEHDDIISQFTSMTGCDAERAKFYLESSNWDLGPAIETYFDADAGDEAADVHMAEEEEEEIDVNSPFGLGAGHHGPAAAPGPSVYPPLFANPRPTAAAAKTPNPSKPSNPPKPLNPPSSSARIATFSSIRKGESDDDSDSERDRDDEQEFYVGSGQEVLGPGKKKNPDELISGIFKSAREHGAEQVEEPSQALQTGQPRSFSGSGMRLGDSSNTPPGGAARTNIPPAGGAARTNIPPPGGAARTNIPPTGGAAEAHNPIVTLRMWRNGFTINEGPLRPYNDPANQQFMDAVKQGRVPAELVMAAKGRELKVQMEDKRDQEYQAPKKPAEYFGGTGQMLGSPAPAVVSKPSTATPQQSETDKKNAEETAKSSVAVDHAHPTTNIQIRLADGSRIVQRFNETHTVADVRRFVQLTRPELSGYSFQMLAGFPLKPLLDDKASLKDANLLNAAINVKLN